MLSHKQMPKCVLKQFVIKEGKLKGKFFCFDVSSNNKDIFPETPKSFNVSEDYYSKFVEEDLSSKIERPLGQLLKFIQSLDYNKQFVLYEKTRETVFNYLFAIQKRLSTRERRITFLHREENSSKKE